MKRLAGLVVPLMLLLSGCTDRAGENPVPTARSHQPDNPSPYGTGAQETRDNSEAKEADSPNDDGKREGEDARP